MFPVQRVVVDQRSHLWCFYAANVGIIAKPDRLFFLLRYITEAPPPPSPHFRDEGLKLNYSTIQDVIQDVIMLIMAGKITVVT